MTTTKFVIHYKDLQGKDQVLITDEKKKADKQIKECVKNHRSATVRENEAIVGRVGMYESGWSFKRY